MAGKLKLKRDTSTVNPPATDQVDVGELVFNAITGKLYSKLANGTVIEFIGKPVCFSRNPTIEFSDVTNFCCTNDILYVTVSDLDLDLYNDDKYIFTLIDITKQNPDSVISAGTPIFSTYDYVGDTTIADPSQPIQPIALGKVIIPYNLILKSTNIFKLSVQIKETNEIVSQASIRISCGDI